MLNEYGRIKYTGVDKSGNYMYTYIKHGDKISLYWEDSDFRDYEKGTMLYTMKQMNHFLDLGLYEVIM